MKQKTTTKTTKRYRYSSFKSRIDDLRIEPARNLEKRAHDYVESSHLLASFEHWKDINLSASFTALVPQLEPLVQTLPQILFHSKQVCALLIEAIDKHDELSLQPELDMLAQFCHDLGPDFMPFYKQAMDSLIALISDAGSLESPQVLEWAFNCLAYLFKYLSRLLTADLAQTSELLFPLLSHHREYLSRFSAEALSFLIRKTSAKNLPALLNYFFAKLSENEEEGHYYEGLLTLFTESLVSTQGSLHSKSNIILTAFITKVLTPQAVDPVCTTLFCDVWMNISKHTAAENLAPVYQLMFQHITEKLGPENTNTVVQIMATLVFSESGKKIPHWETVVSITKSILESCNAENCSSSNLAFYSAALFRNADVRSMTQLHKLLFSTYATKFTDDYFAFLRYCMDLCPDKISSYNGDKYANVFLEENWASQGQNLSLFLLELEQNTQLQNRLRIKIPSGLVNSLLDTLRTINDKEITEEQLADLYWMSVILKKCDVQESDPVINVILNLISDASNPSDMKKDLLGNLILAIPSDENNILINIMEKLVHSFGAYRDSVFFVKSITYLLRKTGNTDSVQTIIDSLLTDNLENFQQNLVLPDSKIRYETLVLISTLYELRSSEVPQLINECKIIEEIPLSLDNGRALTARIRAMSAPFLKIERGSPEIKLVISHMFGLLTIRFSPIWDGVNDFLSATTGKCPDLVWKLILQFINVLEHPIISSYPQTFMDIDSPVSLWDSRVDRLTNTINNFREIWNRFFNKNESIFELSKDLRGSFQYPGQIRNQTLKVMLLVPHLAEQHFADIITYFFNQVEYEELFDNDFNGEKTAKNWTEADRNVLLKVLSKFKNIKNVYKSDELHNRLLTLLGSKNTEVQKLALDAIFAYKEPAVNKYKDNLSNLLNDTLFKDEITIFFANKEKNQLEEQHEIKLMPYILRILYGRAQTPITSGSKKSSKYAVVSVLPNFKRKYIIDFLSLTYNGLAFEKFFDKKYAVDKDDLTQGTLKRMSGFVTLMSGVIGTLGSKFSIELATVLKPLLFVISSSYYICGSDANLKDSDQPHLLKIGSTLRQHSLKCLSEFFDTLGDDLNWDPYIKDIYECAFKPRLANFSVENAQQISSLMRIMVQWSGNESLYRFLYYNSFSCTKALVELLHNPHTKEPVLVSILTACNDVITRPAQDAEYVELVTIISTSTLKSLPTLYERLGNSDSISIAIEVLVNLTENGYVQDDETISYLLSSLTLILESNKNVNNPKIITKMLNVLKTLIPVSTMPFSDLESLFRTLSGFYQTCADKETRLGVNDVLSAFSQRFDELEKVASLMKSLNSYSNRRIQEYDFPVMLSAFKKFTEEDYCNYSEIQWFPVVHTCLFLINDKEELAVRTNATHTLTVFVKYINEKSSFEEAKPGITILKSIILPQIKSGLRKYNDEIQTEYIALLEYIVQNSKYYNDMADMQVLSFGDDEEASFFKNIAHVQLHRRQRAIRRLKEVASELSDNSISHYLIPIAEQYVFSDEEKFRNIANESLITIGELANFMSWNQYKALMRRYIHLLKTKDTALKQSVLLITSVSVALKNTLTAKRNSSDEEINSRTMRKFPNNFNDAESFIKHELYPTLSKILGTRNDDTIVARMPLSEGIINILLGLDEDDKITLLPGVLTSICQVLRSKSEELRDAVRQSLSKIVVILGAKYIVFIIKELVSALQRGSQVHVLSYTVHHVLRTIVDDLNHGDLDDSAHLIVRVIMEDVFGAVGEEKDSDNYHTKMKEVKVNRSYDTGEVLAANISLQEFSTILKPIKMLLMERVSFKSQNKLQELLRHYALGINHNTEAAEINSLRLCYEIFNQDVEQKKYNRPKATVTEQEEFFLVNLNAKKERVVTEYSLLSHTFQKFSLDLLRTVVTRHKSLMQAKYLQGFVPLLQQSLTSDDENVLISTLKVLIILVKIDFEMSTENLFKNCVKKALNIVKDSPSTGSELCQMAIKYLSAAIKHKEMKLKNVALSYVLQRILPDLNEPNKQGLAFNFLKSLISKQVMLPELYDIMTTVREIMITNHSKDIRNVARSVFYHFLMEYDQSKGRLEKQFKFMVDNLQYPAPDGKQSVMELINLIVTKANPELLSKLASSFFIGLANVSVNDDSPRCREMATIILTNMLPRLDATALRTIVKYISAWLKQLENDAFLNLGLRIYKVYLEGLGIGHSAELDDQATKAIIKTLHNTDENSKTQWDLIYSALAVFTVFTNKNPEVFNSEYKNIWDSVIKCLLYPHIWVRQASGKLVCDLFNHLEKDNWMYENSDIQIITSKIIHQLRAPSIPEALAETAIKTLLKVSSYWNKNNVSYIPFGETTESINRYSTAIEYVVSSIGGIIRSEENRNDTFFSKKFAIQYFYLLTQMLNAEALESVLEIILFSLYIYLEKSDVSRLTDEESELVTSSQECMKQLEDSVSVSAFSKAYANVKQMVYRRRLERKNKRSVLAVTAPDVAAAKKLKKHARSREKRKHERDENGYYQRKNKKKRI